MMIPGNQNKTKAQVMPTSTAAAKQVHGEKGNMKIPDSKNKPHPTMFMGDRADYPTPPRTLTGHLPDSRNKGAGY